MPQAPTKFLKPRLDYPALKSGRDARGTFTKLSEHARLADEAELSSFVEELVTVSEPGVLRGLHFQHQPPQAKWIQCLAGHVWDVAVDLRFDSDTFGMWWAYDLSFDGPLLFVPAGFAHGFCVQGDRAAVLLYRFQIPYSPTGEAALRWDDPALSIRWPLEHPILSARDSQALSFADYQKTPLCQSHWWKED